MQCFSFIFCHARPRSQKFFFIPINWKTNQRLLISDIPRYKPVIKAFENFHSPPLYCCPHKGVSCPYIHFYNYHWWRGFHDLVLTKFSITLLLTDQGKVFGLSKMLFWSDLTRVLSLTLVTLRFVLSFNLGHTCWLVGGNVVQNQTSPWHENGWGPLIYGTLGHTWVDWYQTIKVVVLNCTMIGKWYYILIIRIINILLLEVCKITHHLLM